MSRFLTFTTEEALAGRGDRLKEYVIGVEVFDRGESFNPQMDSLVRGGARRLRTLLKGYYAGEGLYDTVRIEFPVGSYVPVFSDWSRADDEARNRSSRGWKLAGLAAGLLVLAAATYFVSTRSGTSRAFDLSSVAVLPFIDLTPQQDQEYLCEGISEELIHALAAVPGVRVTARASAFQFRGPARDLQAIGRKLNVRAVVDGSVLRSGDRLRVKAQLINLADGFHVLSLSYDRELKELLDVQQEIAGSIANAIRAGAGGEARQRSRQHSTGPDAYRIYLQGRSYWNRLNTADVDRSRRYYELAIQKDPTYALAYAGLADVYNFRTHRSRECGPKAEEAARRALQLDPNLAEAHVSLAAQRAWSWDWRAAEMEFRRAIQIDPNLAMARQWYALFYLTPMGRTAEAVEEGRKARDLDPLSAFIHRELGWVLYFARQYEESAAVLLKALELDSQVTARRRLCETYLALGRFEEIIAQCRADDGEFAVAQSWRQPTQSQARWLKGSGGSRY